MLDEKELTAAIDVANRAYKLLLWVDGAIQSGVVSVDHAGTYIGYPDAAEAWLAKHFESFPKDARPLDRAGPELKRFANYLTSYLDASFDLHEVPVSRFVTISESYCCERCTNRVPTSHLKTKKLGQRDKDNAKELVRSFLVELALAEGVTNASRSAEAVLADSELAADAALAAYGAELLRRIDGKRSGPAGLALWRQFAWNDGSPDKKFRLETESILGAERRVAESLRSATA